MLSTELLFDLEIILFSFSLKFREINVETSHPGIRVGSMYERDFYIL